jgi:hypothetical protein
MKHLLTFLLLLAMIGRAAAQNTSSGELPMRAQPIKQSLKQLDDALRQLGGQPAAGSISRSLRWLNDALQQDEAEGYRVSLAQDAFLLGLAVQDPEKSAGLIRDVADDLQLKSNDCQSFGHGRMVPVSIQTLKSDGKPDPGWRIRYVWVPSKKMVTPPTAMYFPGPSSPADFQLPPGKYEVFAERVIDGQARSVNGGPVPVGGTERIEWKVVVN